MSSSALPVKEFCVFAANYLWPARTMVGEQLVLVVHPESAASRSRRKLSPSIAERNRRLLHYKRVGGYLVWERGFSPHRLHESEARRTGRANPKRHWPRSRGAAVTAAPLATAELIRPAVNARFFAIVNPAAGGGRCGALAPAALERVRQLGIDLEVAHTRSSGEATALARARLRARLPKFPGGWRRRHVLRNCQRPFSRSALRSDRPLSVFFRSAPAIHSCAISPRAASTTRSTR